MIFVLKNNIMRARLTNEWLISSSCGACGGTQSSRLEGADDEECSMACWSCP